MFGHFELDAGGLVHDSPAGFDLVDVLATGAAAAAAEFFDVLGVDLDFDIGQFGKDGDGGGAGVDAALGLGFGDSLDAMAAAFEAEMAIGAAAADVDDDFLESAAVGGGEVADVEAIGFGFAIFAIHLIEIADEEAGLLTAGAGADFQEEGIDGVVLGGDEFVFERFEEFGGAARVAGSSSVASWAISDSAGFAAISSSSWMTARVLRYSV